MSVDEFKKMKQKNEKITMLTCYDYWTASILSETDIDCILVGDSLVMVMHGAETTIPATIELMASHTAAVAKGAPNKFIITDLPFCSYRKGVAIAMDAVEKIMRSGANAVKLEGVVGNEEIIEHIVASGIPVMGHIGLTPQSVNLFGGYKVQGKTKDNAQKLLKQAIMLEKAGCFAIVLECMPNLVAEEITDKLNIPTIGIGAGPHVSGQVLVLHDLLGMHNKKSTLKPKFVKTYMQGGLLIESSIKKYITDVKRQKFPSSKYCY